MVSLLWDLRICPCIELYMHQAGGGHYIEAPSGAQVFSRGIISSWNCPLALLDLSFLSEVQLFLGTSWNPLSFCSLPPLLHAVGQIFFICLCLLFCHHLNCMPEMAAVVAHFAVVHNSKPFRGCEKDAVKGSPVPPWAQPGEMQVPHGHSFLSHASRSWGSLWPVQSTKWWIDLHKKSNGCCPFAASSDPKDLRFHTALTNDQSCLNTGCSVRA